MTAIFGVLGKHGRPVPEGLILAMGAALAHRGPDGVFTRREGSIALGWAARRITPESRGEVQPHVLPSGALLVGDVLLDNRDELLDLLSIPGPERSGLPDARLAGLAWERLGDAAFERLDGECALALWDAARRRLLLSKSALGKAPLCYAETSELFAFASEPRALLLVPGVGKTLNVEAFKRLHIILATFDQPEEDLFQGVKKLPGSAVLTVGDGRTDVRRWWRPEESGVVTPRTYDDCCEGVRELLLASLRTRLRSDYPIAALLSGGLDSSSIVCAALRILREQGKGLTAIASVLPEGDRSGRDERAFIDVVAGVENLTPRYVTPPPGTLFSGLERWFEKLLSPGIGPRHYLYDALMAEAAQAGARTLLDGCFGEMGPSAHGLEAFPELLLHGRIATLLRELGLRSRRYAQPLPRLFLALLVRPLLPSRALAALNLLRGKRLPCWQDLSPLRLAPDEAEQLERRLADECFYHGTTRKGAAVRSKELDALHRVNAMGGEGWGDCFAQPVFQFPFANRRLLEFTLATPYWTRLHDGYNRALIRGAMRGILPEAIRLRTCKAPFSPDFHDRFLPEADAALELLADSRPGRTSWELLDVPRIRAAILTLKARGGFEPGKELHQSQLIIQRGVQGVAFLDWLDNYQPGPISWRPRQ